MSPPSARASCSNLFDRPLAHTAQIHTRQNELRWTGEVEKVGDHLIQRFTLVSDAFDVRSIGGWQRLKIEELAVTLNCCQTVSEFMSDPGGQLTDCGEAFFQSQLLLEILDRREIRK